jgi:preprotein translocase subunit SecE
MAKEAGSDQKAIRKRAAKGKQDEAERGATGDGRVLAMTKEGASKPVAWVRGAWEVSQQFLREVRAELKKVTWPSRKETLASTGIVLIVVFLVAMYLGLVDMALSKLIGSVLH